MAVKVYDANRAVAAVDAAQQRQRDGVVAAERDDARQRAVALGQARLGRRRVWLAREQRVVALFDLPYGVHIVVSINLTPY